MLATVSQTLKMRSETQERKICELRSGGRSQLKNNAVTIGESFTSLLQFTIDVLRLFFCTASTITFSNPNYY